MPNVPVISEPSEQPERLPVVPQGGPPAGAFPIGVGATAEEFGSEVQRVAYQEKELTHRINAAKAENSFQDYMINERTSYLALSNEKALAALPALRQRIVQKKAELSQGLNSRYAQALADIGMMRIERVERGPIESHYDQQRRNIQIGLIRDTSALAAKDLSSYAGSSVFNLDDAEKKMKGYEAQFRESAQRLGMGQEQEDAFVKQHLAAPAGAMVKMLTDLHSPLAQAVFDKWGELADPSRQDQVAKALLQQSAQRAARSYFDLLPRFDRYGKDNPHGFIPRDKIEEIKNSLPDDQRGDLTRAYLDRLVQHADSQFNVAGGDLANRVEALGKGKGPGGAFAYPKDSVEGQELEALYPKAAEAMQEHAASLARSYTSAQRTARNRTSGDVYGAVAEKLETIAEQNPDQLQGMTKEYIKSEMRSAYSGVSDKDIVRAQDKLAALKKARDPLTAQFRDAARELLADAYGDKAKDVNVYRFRAVNALAQAHADHPDEKDIEKLKAIVRPQLDKPWFKARPIESYHRPVKPTGIEAQLPLPKAGE